MRYQSKGVLLALAIVGCVVARHAKAAEEAGLGTKVPEAEMTMFCQNAAAARFEVQLDAIATDPPIRREGKLLVLGTVDSDDDSRDAAFNCRFEEKRSLSRNNRCARHERLTGHGAHSWQLMSVLTQFDSGEFASWLIKIKMGIDLICRAKLAAFRSEV